MTQLEQKISGEIKTAMLTKNVNRLRALRGIKTSLDLINTSGKEVTDEIQSQSLQKMIKTRKESADIYKNNNRADLYESEVSEIIVIEEFLPKQLTEDEIKIVVQKTITETGASSIKDMGKVIGIVSKQLLGKADGRLISNIVKSLIS